MINKTKTILVVMIMILTIFSSFNFIAQPVSASPPATGDIAHSNASVSYTRINYWQTQPTTNLKLWGSNNSTATSLTINYAGSGFGTNQSTIIWMGGSRASVIVWLHNYTYNGAVNCASAYGFVLDNGLIGTTVNILFVNVTIDGILYSWNYVLDASGLSTVAFVPHWHATIGIITSLNVTITGGTFYAPSSNPLTTTGNAYGNGTNGLMNTASIPPWSYGWNYDYISISSSYSLPSNLASYEINWTAAKISNATYNSVTQSGATSGHFLGSLSVTSITFNADFININQDPYAISYFLTENTTTPESYTYSEQTYTYTISQNGNYFNSSFVYFNYTLPSTASTSFSASYSLKISNLTLTNPSAPVDSLSLVAPSFTYYSLSKYKSTYNITAYQNYSSAQNANTKFSTSEIVNYYPTINYSNIKWTGTGSKAELVINATTVGSGYTFSESLQILNINWGDGSALQSSSEQTGKYNWTLYHFYQSVNSYSVSFQVENWIGSSNALSTTKTLTYTISITVTNSPANNAIIPSGQKIWFNWTNQNAGMTSASLKIDSVLQESNTYSSQLSGSISFSPTYLGTLSVSWFWTAGNISGYNNLTYSTSTHIGKTGLYVLVNYTVSSTSYSSYYYYSQISPYNLTWSYFTWNIQIPNGSILSSIKGNTSWVFQSGYPGLYAYYSGNASIHFYLKSTIYQVVWLAPLPPSFGYFTIDYAPTSPVMQMLGIGIGSNAFKTYVNGIQTSSLQIPAQVGNSYNIKAYDTFGSLVVNTTYIPQYQFSTDEISVSYFPVTFTNLNSSWKIQLTIASNGVTLWGLPHIMPEGGELTLYMPPGTYWFNATYLGYLNNTAGISVDKLFTISNVTDEVFAGITIAMVQTTAVKNAQNLTELVDSVNITFVNSNSKVYNETLRVNASIINTNSTVKNELAYVFANLTFIKSVINNVNVSLLDKFSLLNTSISSFRSNITVVETYINDTINYIKSLVTKFNQNLTLVNTTVVGLKLIASQNFTAINSTLKKNYDSLFSNVKFLNSTLLVFKGNFTSFLTFFNSTIGKVNNNVTIAENVILSSIKNNTLSITTKETLIKSIVSFVANSSMQYKFTFAPSTVVGNSYNFIVYATELNGNPLNLTQTRIASENLKLYYIEGMNEYPLSYNVNSINAGRFSISVYGLNYSTISSLINGQSTISATSNIPVSTPTGTSNTSAIVGLIGSQQVDTFLNKFAYYMFTPFVSFISLISLLVIGTIIYLFYVFTNIPKRNRRFRLFITMSLLLTWFILYAIYRGGLL